MTAKTNVVQLARGEERLEIDGVEYALRPTPAAISAIETRLGVEVVPLIMRLQRGEVGFTTLHTVLYECMAAATPRDERISRERLGEFLMVEGIQHFMELQVRLLGTVYGKEYDAALAADAPGNGSAPAE